MGATLGEQFVEALAAKDFERASSLFHPEVDFRGLTPGRLWEAATPRQIVDEVLPSWFEENDRIDEVLWVENGHVADLQRVSYQLAVSNADGPFVTEQQAFYDVKEGAITWMRVLCSGWRPRSET